VKYYESVEFLSIFECQAPAQTQSLPAETQSPPIENFLATVLFTPMPEERLLGKSYQGNEIYLH